MSIPPHEPYESAYRDAKGDAEVKSLSSQLLATFVRGESAEAMVFWYFREFHRFVDRATRKVDIFHDWGDVSAFTPAARRTFTDWAKTRRALNARACRSVHTLVGSTLGYLALEATGGFGQGYLHAYRDRATFERERARRLLAPSTDPVERSSAAS